MSIVLRGDVREQLDELVAARGTSMTGVVRALIQEEFARVFGSR